MHASAIFAAGSLVAIAQAAAARAPGEPIRLVWAEGDVAGMSTIYGPDGRDPIGFIEYHQTRHGDRLSSVRIARFRDGSSDEDWAEARVEGTLDALTGRSITRDTHGEVVVDMTIDVPGGRVTATWGDPSNRQTADEHVALPAGTYWGPLIFILLKNFDANAESDKVVFRTVAPTPKPMVLDMEITRRAATTLERTGARLEVRPFDLSPTIHWAIDPLVRLIAPRARFFMLPGDPPALARFSGPRNYARQEIVIQ